MKGKAVSMKTKTMSILLVLPLLFTLLAACQTGGEQTMTGDGTISDTSVSTTMTITSSTPPESTRVTTSIATATTEAPQETTVPLGIITLCPNPLGETTRESLAPEELPPTYPPYFYNSEYGYGIEFPESWAGRYNIDMHNGANVAFCQSASFGREGTIGGVIFELVAMELKYAPELEDMEVGTFFTMESTPWEFMLMGRNRKYAIVAEFPSDVQYDMEGPNAEMVGKEYKAMADDIRQLRFIMRFPFYKFSNS